jgi:DNA-directed RNA polymerase subunit RPC12/RpoP
MKCSKCGKEFGEGINCQYCGVDRVTGLGNYSGYDRPTGSFEPQYNSSNNGGVVPNTTVCYACNEIIPANSEFCPYCSKQLYVTCPKCGNTYSSQFSACNKCGTNLNQYYRNLEAEEKEAKKKDEEKRRKQREWEKREEDRQQIRDNADRLRAELSYRNIGCVLLFCIFMFLSIVPPIIWTNDLNKFVYLALPFVSVIIGSLILNQLGDNRIEKWKKEHPNDPRSKYL